MTNTASDQPIPISAWIYAALCVVTVADAFAGRAELAQISAGLIVLFIVLEFKGIPTPQKLAGLLLIALALAAAAVSGEWKTILLDGISRSRIFLVLFFAIAWLQFPVRESPSLNAVRSNIVSQPPGRRYLYLTYGVHVLGSVLNLAGLSLLTTIVERQKELRAKRRLSVALMQGFTAASCWSPFYIGMIVVLVSVPGVTWLELAPAGAVMAILVILSGWTFDRLVQRPGRVGPVRGMPPPVSKRHLTAAVFILVSLVGLAMVLVEATGTNIPVTLAIMGPVYALIWFGTLRGRRETSMERYRQLAGTVIRSLPGYRNEALLFVAANMFGVGIATIIPSGDMSAALNSVLPWADAKLVLLMATFLLASAAGLHPVIIVISVSAVFPPAALGISEFTLALTFLGAWGISTMVSPFSGTTLFMSRVAGVPGHVIGWRWSPPVVILSAVVVLAVVILLRHVEF